MRHRPRNTLDEAESRVRAWATAPSATVHWADDSSAWLLRTGRRAWWSPRRHYVTFPHPSELTDAGEAARWETMARVAAAEHTSSGATGTWFGSILAGTVFGLGASGLTEAADVSAAPYWVKLLTVSLAASMVFLVLAMFVFSMTGRALLREHESGPMWWARADAYARRRAELEVAPGPLMRAGRTSRIPQRRTRVLGRRAVRTRTGG